MPRDAPKRSLYDGLEIHRPYLAPVERLGLLGFALDSEHEAFSKGQKRGLRPMPASIQTAWGPARVAPDAAALWLPRH